MWLVRSTLECRLERHVPNGWLQPDPWHNFRRRWPCLQSFERLHDGLFESSNLLVIDRVLSAHSRGSLIECSYLMERLRQRLNGRADRLL